MFSIFSDLSLFLVNIFLRSIMFRNLSLDHIMDKEKHIEEIAKEYFEINIFSRRYKKKLHKANIIIKSLSVLTTNFFKSKNEEKLKKIFLEKVKYLYF